MNNESLMPVCECLDALQKHQRGISPETIAKSMSPEARDIIGWAPPVATDSDTLHGLASIARHQGQRPPAGPAPLSKAVGTKRRQSAGERLRQQRDDQQRRKSEQRDREQSDAKFTKSMAELATIQSKLTAARGSHTAARWRDDRQRSIKLYKALRADLDQMPGKVPADIVNAVETRLNHIGAGLARLGLI